MDALIAEGRLEEIAPFLDRAELEVKGIVDWSYGFGGRVRNLSRWRIGRMRCT